MMIDLANLAKVRIEPDEILVLRMPASVPEERRGQMAAAAYQAFQPARVLVIDEAVRLEVIKPLTLTKEAKAERKPGDEADTD